MHECLLHRVTSKLQKVQQSQLKLAQLSYSTRGIIPDGMLMRVSSIDADSSHAYDVQERLVQALFTAIAPGMRSFVFGRAND